MNKKIIFSIGAIGSIMPAAMAISCTNNKKTNDKGKNFTIATSWFNPGFISENNQKGKDVEFKKTLAKAYEELAAKNNNITKEYKKLNFMFKSYEDKSTAIQALNNNNAEFDMATFSYNSLVDYYDTDAKIDNSKAQILGQTQTLKFSWSDIAGTNYYTDGTANDPLYLGAQKENEIQFSAPYGEFPTWNDENASPYFFDGSKYAAFYSKNELTSAYHGAIYISGTPVTRDKITKDWLDKNYDAFLKNGIVYKKASSGGGFKYQAKLLAEHFGKNLADVIIDLTSSTSQYKDYILKKSVSDQLGKTQENGKAYNVGFSDEGEFNWTPKSWGADLFKPSDFNNGAVVRVLTLTNPAPYDAILGKAGLNTEVAKTVMKALASLSVEDNLLGIYTGYNKFNELTKEQFKQFIAAQKYTQGITNTKPAAFPNITNA